jgi:hypothetical protein
MHKHSTTNTDKGKHQDSQGYRRPARRAVWRARGVVWGGVVVKYKL